MSENTITVTLTAAQVEVLNSLIGYAFDQAHDWFERNYLEETFETTDEELTAISAALNPAKAEKIIAEGEAIRAIERGELDK
jgi:hypothetical protein